METTFYEGYRDDPPVYGWTPKYPCASYGCFSGPPEEALFRSNYRVTLEVFKEAGLEDCISAGTNETFEILASSTRAIALAESLEEDAAYYPVLDEGDYSDLETEIILEGIDSWFRDDLIEMFDHDPAFDGIFGREADPDGLAARRLEEEIRAIAFDAVAYSGELYVSSISEHVRNMSGSMSEGYAANIRRELAHDRRVEFERCQPAIPNL